MKTIINPSSPLDHTQTSTATARRVGFSFALAALLGTLVPTELRAQVIVVPNAQATNDGNASVTTPTGRALVRYMQIHHASQFADLSRPSFLTQFAFRPDRNLGQSGPRTATLRIYASTTSRSVNGLSPTFADNPGTNNTLVFEGALIWTTKNESGPGNTRQFDIAFPLATPFLYDPAAGNLLLEFQQDADGSAITFDRESGNPFTRQVVSGGSTGGSSGGFGDSQVIQFTFAPPPLATIRTSQVDVCWNGPANLTYQVQYRSDLTGNLWMSLVDCVRGTGSTSCISDPVVAGQPQRFYRVVPTLCVP